MKKSSRRTYALILILLGLVLLSGVLGAFPFCIGYILVIPFGPSVCVGYSISLAWVLAAILILGGIIFYLRSKR